MFGTPAAAPTTPTFGTPAAAPSTPTFGTPAAAPSTPTFGTPAANPFFSTPQPPSQPSPFALPQSSPFSFVQPPATTQVPTAAAALPFSLPSRDVQAIVDAYKNEPSNASFAFRHLLFSVTDPAGRVKPVGVSDIMWAEAMGKLEGMESSNRERLWPQLVQGFKDLSARLKLQDEVILSDAERLRMTQSNVKLLQRHFQADTIPWIQRMRQKEQVLQRRLLRVMRILEALENKGYRVPLTKGEVELAEKLATLAKQSKGSGAELARRVHNLLSVSRMRANNGVIGNSIYLHGPTKIDEQSLLDMQEVLQQQTEAISRLGNVLKRDARDMEIIMPEDTEMTENGGVSY